MKFAPGLAWLLAVCALAQPSVDPVTEFARRVAAGLQSRPASLTGVRSLAGDAKAVPEDFERRFQAALLDRGARLAADASVALHITLSANAEGSLWVAEIVEGEKREVILYAPPATIQQRPREQAVAVTLRKNLLIEGEQPVLDAAVVDGRLLVLEPGQVVSYAGEPGRWERQALAPVSATSSRDPRGRLQVMPEGFRVHVPGITCEGGVEPSLDVHCSESKGRWPLGPANAAMAPGRNFFDGRVWEGGVERRLPAFYSGVPMARNGEPAWLIASTSGRLLLFEKVDEPVAAFAGWGSDVALLEGVCEDRNLVLATRSSETAESDAVTALELRGRQLLPAGPALEFSGSVTALWSFGKGALVVVRDANTRRYAAYEVSVACGG
jgi:hypothetical protein